MKQSNTFRENAENCMRLAERAATNQTSLRYRRMARAWSALADEQDWLDGEIVTANDNIQVIIHGPNSQS